jgi:hypothetical protein
LRKTILDVEVEIFVYRAVNLVVKCGGPIPDDDALTVFPQDFWMLFYKPTSKVRDGRSEATKKHLFDNLLWNAAAGSKMATLHRGLLHTVLLPHSAPLKHHMRRHVSDVDTHPSLLLTASMNNWLAEGSRYG